MPNEIDVEIGERIRKRRRQRGLSQDALGALLEISTFELQGFEKGRRRIGANLLQKVCKKLDVSPSYFLAFVSPSRSGDSYHECESPRADIEKLTEAFLQLNSSEARKLIVDLAVSLSGHHLKQAASAARQDQGTQVDAQYDRRVARGKIINLRGNKP
jgi:transcriptional regulator with XRE-family HTH domain